MSTDTQGDDRGEAPPPKPDRSRDLSRLSRHGWIAGLAGAATVLAMGYQASRRHALDRGWNLWTWDGPQSPHLTPALALLVCAAVMFAIELGVRLRVDRGRVLSIPDGLREGRIGPFLRECLLVYLVELGILRLSFALYRILNVYAHEAAYYRPWLDLMSYFWTAYLWGGLPYVILTRALQHDPRADRKQAAFTAMKAAKHLARRLGLAGRDGDEPEPFDGHDRSAILGLLVKLFFVPVMTVFFSDQFTHLVKNWGFVLDTVIGTGKPVGVGDFYNVSFTVIFSIDVGLAWSGYVLSSRWIKNTLWSVEPTLLGWTVALLSYPPFNRVFGFYFSTPGESGFLTIGWHPAVVFLAVCSVLSFTVYTSATVCFGLRFSNLTHRGIITTGPYAYVRHPAYAAKNFSWWCVMLPFALYQAGKQWTAAPLLQVLGLVMMSAIYYWRALTEERHLSQDAEYRVYAKKVRYRFIPGVL